MKHIRKLLMCLIIILLILCSMTTVYAANKNYYNGDTNRYHYYLRYDTAQGIATGAELTVGMYGKSNPTDSSGKYIGALFQPHIYCVEHGARLRGKIKYKVSAEYTVQDPILAYILNHGPAMGSLEENYSMEPSQLALWHYLNKFSTDNSKTDRINMVGNKGQHANHSGTTYDCCYYLNNPNDLYKEAEEYAKNINVTPGLTLELVEDSLKIKVTGNFEKFNILINGAKYATRTKSSSAQYTEEINIEDYTTETLNVKIEAIKTTYIAKYHVLTHEKDTQQRSIAVVALSTGESITGSVNKTIEIGSENVSLQKYITEVNDSPVTTTRANRKATGESISKISYSILNSTGTVKESDTVKIEAGDYVTYNIVVYNNSNLKSKKIKITDTLPDGVTKYSINGGAYKTITPSITNTFEYTIDSLGPIGSSTESKTITVKVYFGEYRTGTLINNAKITSPNPANEEGYRIEDSDYVEMREYSVSLEKYITAINNNSSNTQTSTNVSTYHDIIDYLIDNKIITEDAIRNFIDTFTSKNVSIDSKYDLNGDKVISEEDLLIYQKSKNMTADTIQSYINADLNEDGHVDSVDLNIYKIIKTNLKDDLDLNDYDRYMLILKSMYSDNIARDNAVYYLYTQRLLNKTGKDKESVKADIDSYLKSDINDDGYVDSIDDYKIENNKVIIDGQEYDINENINNLPERESTVLQSHITKYDINDDGILDNAEIEFYNDYKIKDTVESKYYYIAQNEYQDIIKLGEILKELVTVNIEDDEDFIEAYDSTDDSKVYFDDCMILKETYADEFSILNDELKITVDNDEFISELDLNDDNVIDYSDYEILTENINFLEFLHNYIQDQNRINELEEAFIEEITISRYNRKYDLAYDLNGDNKIDFEDCSLAKEQNEEIYNVINYLLESQYINNMYDFNRDDKVNYEDYEFLTQYYIEIDLTNKDNINTIIDTIISEINSIIANYSVFDEELENKNFEPKDIYVIEIYIGLKKYDSYYNLDTFDYTLYDINQDGLINEQDKILIDSAEINNEVLKQLNVSELDTFITFFNENYNDNLSKITLDEIANTYEKISTNITDINNSKLCITEILESQSYLDNSLKVSYSDIENASNMNLQSLDTNSDGIVNQDDIEFLESHREDVAKVNSFEEAIITDNDINKDGKVDNSDIEFSNHISTIKNNDNIENEIIKEVTGKSVSNGQTSTDGTVSGREGHPLYNKNNFDKSSESNHVRVEAGDTVTYTIKLTNTGDYPIKVTEIIDTFDGNKNADLVYVDGSIKGYGTPNVKVEDGKLTITISNPIIIQKDQSKYFTLQFKVTNVKDYTTEQILINTAEVTKIENKNNIDVLDSDGRPNNIDSDYVRTKLYKVSLEKYVSEVKNNNTDKTYPERSGKAEYLTKVNNIYQDQTDNDTKWTKHNSYKYNNVVEVSNGDQVTYTITVTNNGETNIYITEIADYLPDGVKYKNTPYNGAQYDKTTDNEVKFNDLAGTLLLPNGSASFTITVEVVESNMSINTLKNTAKITKIKNKNNVEMDADTCDKTPFNNMDSDYIKLRDITISGNVWNDKALNKLQDNYNGLFDSSEEKGIPNIKVSLYRVGSAGSVATKYTDANGNYSFSSSDIDNSANGIKASKVSSTENRWKSYHSYYVVFEYDGVTYTSTPNGTTCKDITNSNYKIDSNAREDNNLNKNIGVKSRENFNKEFNPINNGSGISYTTKNEDGYIPQSNHNAYDSNGKLLSKYKMQSSTNCINIGNLANQKNIEDMLQNVDLGLRGRDIFDLELTSDVSEIKVTVNEKQGVYKYANKVTLRKSDLTPNSTTDEDMANKVLEASNTYVDRQNQNIRTSDLDMSKAGTNGESYSEEQGISNIEVTYKITVHNASRTLGTATKVTNYYDSRYTFVKAYCGDKNLSTANGISSENYKSVVITTPGTMLNQAGKMEIYVVYTLNNPAETLKGLTAEGLATYNMAEITEYKTGTASNQTKYTKGLIDKDSAPGSVSIENVRLTEGTSAKTTLSYYFGGNDLSKLKYEDDTYATPTLYFVADSSQRMITGTVFEDYTQIINNDGEDQTIRVKTGDGKQIGDEPGIKGATVKLYEIRNGNKVLRYTVQTNENGDYTISGFLPGEYIIEYQYGDRDETFLVDNNPNTKSYNGEDFQSTNNTGLIAGKEYENIKLYKLNNTDNFWYVYNESEGISTATDDGTRREAVSTNVTNFEYKQMAVLNNARDGKAKSEAEIAGVTVDSIKDLTKMSAYTKSMTLTMEETVKDENDRKQNNAFLEYNVSNMNFGIAEVPVTTIDLQKHVHSFTLKDSTGTNTLAALEKDLNNTAVVVNPSKIAANRINTVIEVLSNTLEDIDENEVRELISYDQNKNTDENISIKTGVKSDEIDKLKDEITYYSLAREIEIVQAWKVTAGNVIAPAGAHVIDVSVEDDKLQGAKLEITYEISANIYAEKNFNNDAVTVPSIEGIVDYIDNNLSYNKDSQNPNGTNSAFWTVAKQTDVKFGEGEYKRDFGTLDTEGTKYTTVLSANEGSELLRKDCGEGKVYITLEKVLSSSDITLEDIITSNVDVYEYQNSVEITSLNYQNQTESNNGEQGGSTGNSGGNSQGGNGSSSDDSFVYRDRIRTADRYIILPGIQYDSASSEIVTIHPPTGDSSINTIYLVIAAISLVVLAGGAFGIKKFVLKK